MAETATEEKKEKAGAFSGMLYTATVTAEGAGAVCDEEVKVDITDAGIRLNLMRIAIINRSKKHQPLVLKDITEEQFKEYKGEGLPPLSLSNYKYALTTIRTGFLYIVNETDEKGWSEWVINDASGLSEILQDEADKDLRDVSKKSRKLKQYLASPSDLLYIAYSDVQWSAAYWEKMRTDCEARAKRMQIFDASKQVSKTVQPNVLGPVQAQENVSCLAEDKSKLNNTQFFFNQAFADAENNEIDYDIDPVICLHDPVGVAQELTSFLDYYWLKMESLLISMKIGVTQLDVEKALRQNKDPKSLQNKEDLEQIEALHKIAVTLKAVAYSGEDIEDKLIHARNGIEIERINKVLAAPERLKIKKSISKIRTQLFDFLDGDYFGLVVDDYLENCDDTINYVKFSKAHWLKKAAMMPNAMDVALENKNESAQWGGEENDRGRKFVNDIVNERNHVGKILNTPSVVSDIEKEVNKAKYALILDSFFELTKSVFKDGPEALQVTVAMVNRVHIGSKGNINKAAFKVQELGELFIETNLGRSDFFKKTINLNKKTLKAFKKINKGNKLSHKYMKLKKAKLITFTKPFEDFLIKNDPSNTLDKINGSKIWLKLLRNISMVNVAMTGTNILRSGDYFQGFLNISKFGVAITEAYMALESIKALKFTDEFVIEAFDKHLRRIGKVAGYAGGLIDAGESAYNFWQRDFDAGMAYGGAAAAGVAGTWFLLSAANFWNPAGIILLIGAVGLGIWAGTLEDTPIEMVAKNGIFGPAPTIRRGAKIKFPATGYLSLLKFHIKEDVRDGMHKLGFTDLEDLPEQYRQVLNALASPNVILKANKKSSQSSQALYMGDMAGETIISYRIDELLVQASFGSFLNSIDQLDFKLLYLANGFGGSVQILSNEDHIKQQKIIKEESGLVKGQFVLNTSGSSIGEKAVLIVACKIEAFKGQFFPINKKGQEVYVAALTNVHVEQHLINLYYNGYDSKLISGTIQELTKEKVWKNA